MEQPEGNDMRKIEQSMMQAVYDRRNWRSGNTEVIQYPDYSMCEVVLHGSVIATVEYLPHSVRHVTLTVAIVQRWPTRTTCSRLRALGVDVEVVRGKAYIDGRAV